MQGKITGWIIFVKCPKKQYLTKTIPMLSMRMHQDGFPMSATSTWGSIRYVHATVRIPNSETEPPEQYCCWSPHMFQREGSFWATDIGSHLPLLGLHRAGGKRGREWIVHGCLGSWWLGGGITAQHSGQMDSRWLLFFQITLQAEGGRG